MADPTKLPAYDANGAKVYVRAQDAAVLQQQGGRLATDEDVAAERVDAQAARANEKLGVAGKIGYSLVGGLPSVLGGGQGLAWQQAVARGGTAGLSDLATKEAAEYANGKPAGAQTVQLMDDAKTGYSTTSSLGEAAGTIAATAATAGMGGPGGGTGLMRFAGPAGISSMLGGAAEGGLARVIGGRLGAGIAGQALKTGLTMGARGLAEGAFMSGVQQANEDLLRDRDLSAEKILAASAHGALIGGATGFGLGAGGSLAGAGGRGLLSSFSSAAGRAEGGLARVAGTADDALMRAEAAAGKAESAAAGMKVAKEGMLGDLQNEAAYRALSGTKKDVQRIAGELGMDAPQASKELGKFLVSKGAVAAGDDATSLLGKISSAKDEVGTKIGAALEGSGARVNFADIVKDAAALSKEAGTKYESVAVSGQIKKSTERLAAALDSAGVLAPDGTISLSDLATQRRSIANMAYGSAARSETASADYLRRFERTIESKIVDALETGGAAKPDAFGGILRQQGVGNAAAKAEYLALKKEYQMYSLAEKVAEHGAAQQAGNNFLSLRGAGAAVGAAVMSGQPLAALPVALGSKLLTERGMSTAAAALGNVSQLGVLRGITQTMDELVGRASKGIVTPAKVATKGIGGAAPKVNQVEKATQSIAALAKVQANPQGFADRLAQHTEPIRAVSPELAGSYTETATRAMAFLAGKMPERLPANDPINPNAQRTLTTTDAIKFNRSVEAVTDPKAVMEEMSRGIVIPEHVEAIRAVYPSLFRQMQVAALEQVATAAAKGKPISFNARLRLGVVMDAPTDASLTVSGIQFRQGNVATPPDTKNTMPQRPIEVRATKLTSQYDRIEGGE